MRLRIVIVCCVLSAAAVLYAGDEANINRGFSADSVFHTGDIDTVNLFNGNLIVNIPIAPAYPLNAGYSYGVALVYTGNPWDFVKNVNSTTGEVTWRSNPNPRSNAGLGWRVSIGKLIRPSDPTNVTSTGSQANEWLYESPDGARHMFYTSLHGEVADTTHLYTRDDTYLRLTFVGSTFADIEFPDGRTERYSQTTGLLQHMRTPFATVTAPAMTVTYPAQQVCTGVDSDAVSCWVLSDATSARTSYVTFKSNSNAGPILNKIILPTANGNAIYTAEYNSGGPDSELFPDPGSCGGYTTGISPTYFEPQLTALTLPDGSKYSFTYYGAGDQFSPTCSSGSLKQLTLPTRGSVAYKYGRSLPGADNVPYIPGVVSRSRLAPNGTSVSYTTYEAFTGDTLLTACTGRVPAEQRDRELDVTVTVKSAENAATILSKSEQFFSIKVTVTCPNDSETWDSREYGLPLTRHVSHTDGGVQRFLSSRVYSPSNPDTVLRETYVLYAMDGTNPSSSRVGDNDRRLLSSATLFLDDCVVPDQAPCTSWRYSASDSSDFDGLGHYRTIATSGNFTRSNAASATTAYNPARGTYGINFVMLPASSPWLLNTYSARSRTEGTATEKSTYCFDGATGLLTRVRRLKGAAEAQDDTIAVFDDAAGSSHFGNLTKESYYGGDGATLATGTDLCTIALPSTASYVLAHTYASGVRATSEYQANGSGVGFKILDRTVDASGFITSERDPAGVETTFTYDAANPLRLSAVVDGAGKTEYSFINASVTNNALTNATVTATRKPLVGTDAAATKYVYDAFGRLITTTRDMPAGATATQSIDYDGLDRKVAVSEWETASAPTHKTWFDYDAFDRVVRRIAPDLKVSSTSFTGVSSSAATTTVHTGTGDSDAITTSSYDGQGRLQSVTEPNGTVTSYGYDADGRLASVCANDVDSACGQARAFVYDGRGFLSSETHPENGTVSYTYDARGHVLTRRLASQSQYDLNYTYDAAERLTNINSRNPDVPTQFRPFKDFSYWTSGTASAKRISKLASDVRYNYDPTLGTTKVVESYDYDGAGRVASKETVARVYTGAVTGDGTLLADFNQAYAYNEFSLPTTITYPTCAGACGASPAASISPQYSKGYFTGVSNYGTVTYSPSGMPHTITHGGTVAVVDTIAPTADGMARPQSITFDTYSSCSVPSLSGPPNRQVAYGTYALLSVAASGSSPFNYQWYSATTNLPISGATDSSFQTPALTADAYYYVVVWNACGRVVSSTAVVQVCDPPYVAAQPQSRSASAGDLVSLTVTANGCSPLSYQWYRGSAPDSSSAVGGNSSSLSITVTATVSYWVRITSALNATVDSQTATITVAAPINPPSSLVASRFSATEVALAWQGSSNAHHYRVERRSGASWTPIVLAVFGTSYHDSSLPLNTTFLYRIRAEDQSGNNFSAYTNVDLCTTTSFRTLTATQSAILADDFEEIRRGINSVRAAVGAAPATWLDILGPGINAPAPNQLILAAHLTKLRAAMDAALAAASAAVPAYGEAIQVGITPIRAAHIQELWGRTKW